MRPAGRTARHEQSGGDGQSVRKGRSGPGKGAKVDPSHSGHRLQRSACSGAAYTRTLEWTVTEGDRCPRKAPVVGTAHYRAAPESASSVSMAASGAISEDFSEGVSGRSTVDQKAARRVTLMAPPAQSVTALRCRRSGSEDGLRHALKTLVTFLLQEHTGPQLERFLHSATHCRKRLKSPLKTSEKWRAASATACVLKHQCCLATKPCERRLYEPDYQRPPS